MTIEKLLQEFQEEHGNDWPIVALERLLDLNTGSLTVEELAEFILLYKWALETIKAGIAFKQSQEEA